MLLAAGTGERRAFPDSTIVNHGMETKRTPCLARNPDPMATPPHLIPILVFQNIVAEHDFLVDALSFASGGIP